MNFRLVPVAQVSEKAVLIIADPIIAPLGMQGKKDYQEKLFAHFQLSNVYRRTISTGA